MLRRGCCHRVAHHSLLDWLRVWSASGGWSTEIMRKENKGNYSLFAGINKCSLLHIKKITLLTLLPLTVDLHMLSYCTGWMAFLQCVDRRKRLGGAESRSVGDSARNDSSLLGIRALASLYSGKVLAFVSQWGFLPEFLKNGTIPRRLLRSLVNKGQFFHQMPK